MLELNVTTFEETIQSEQPVVVDFWAPWCMPCKIFSPILEEVAEALDGKVTMAKVDIDDHGELAARFSVESIPTLIVFKNGEEVDRVTGLLPKDNVTALIETHL